MDHRAVEEQTATHSVRLNLGVPGTLEPVPGLVVLFADGRPTLRTFRVGATPIELGRVELAEGERVDSMISRQHLRVACDGAAFVVTDLNSHNGSYAAGRRISGEMRLPAGTLIRLGGVLLLAVADVVSFKDYGLGIEQGAVGGPSFRRALETVAMTQQLGFVPSLLISGESGTGKEIAAQVFHRAAGKPKAPFTAVNCATIPKELAERLLFGSRRGAFSGATDAPGYVHAASGGTLFLDEVAELPLEVQSKLLRMLETREVLPLGATKPESVDVRVCAATWRNLRQEVATGRFREDLYFRIGQPEVQLPPLRERVDEIPWHVQHVLDAWAGQHEFHATANFLEACSLRPWPGNVRELRAEVRRAAAVVAARGSSSLNAEDLSPAAGQRIERAASSEAPASFPADEFAAALTAERGNVLGAARQLGVHRNKVRRWLERHGVDPRSFRA
jgi:transcriptional regulator of acetoin/glycerol metabolism